MEFQVGTAENIARDNMLEVPEGSAATPATATGSNATGSRSDLPNDRGRFAPRHPD